MPERLGSPVSSKVIEQLTLRSQVNSRLSETDFFSPEPIQSKYISTKLHNSAWITCLSSVDFLNTEQTLSGPDLAKKLVLSGGSLRWDGEKFVGREGIDYTARKSTYDISNNVYSNSTLGVRPMPGITSFSIASKNLYGTLREATIEFVVWSIDDLEIIERLYLRPGYHMVVEWGHTYGLDNSGNVVRLEPKPSHYKDLFTRISADQVYSRLVKNKEEFFYNYDGFLGMVKNFTWNFRPDGGYNCSISVISKGEILESLSTRSGLPTGTEQIGEEKEHEDFCNTNLLTRLSCVLSVVEGVGAQAQQTAANLSNAGKLLLIPIFGPVIAAAQAAIDLYDKAFTGAFNNQRYDKGSEFPLTLQGIETCTLATDYYTDVIKVAQQYVDEGFSPNLGFLKYVHRDDGGWWRNLWNRRKTSDKLAYINLRFLLYYINVMVRDISSSKKPSLFNYLSDEPFFTFKGYTNLAPDSVLVWKNPLEPELFPIKAAQGNITDITAIVDLFITDDLLMSTLSEFIHTELEPEEFDVISFIMSLLKKMETAMGGINDFGLDYDEETNLYTIVDRKFSSTVKKEDVPQINIVGENSIATQVSIETKITNKLGSQISISAQGPDAESKFNNSIPEFKKWNANLIDRYDQDVTTPAIYTAVSGSTFIPAASATPATSTTNAGPIAQQSTLNPTYSFDLIKAAVLKKGYRWFEQEGAMNIVGVRTVIAGNRLTDLFDDKITISYKLNGKWTYLESPATTDPGSYYLRNFEVKSGVAILVPGQYISSHSLGYHRGQYQALVATRLLNVYRDGNKDKVYNFVNPQVNGSGINIHRASSSNIQAAVNNWSAGCQVFVNPKDFNTMISLAKQLGQFQKPAKNLFTYTLLLSTDVK